jgi:hypothetical protein
MLERAVTWIIILIVIVFDPLAVIMLLAAQMTFGWKKEKEEPLEEIPVGLPVVSTQADEILKQGVTNSDPKDNTPLTTEFEGVREPGGEWVQTGPEIEYQFIEEFHEEDPPPVTADSTKQIEEVDPPMPIEQWNTMLAEAEKAVEESAMVERLAKGETYIDGAGVETALEPVYSEEDGSKKKTYMIKDPTGQIQVKNRD